jgi:MYXO-CTERM domain-containing protein
MNLIALLMVPSSLAATITVNADGSGDYSSVQSAVDAASSGDTIQVASGTYVENVSVSTKTLYIEGSGVGATVIEGDGSSTVLSVQGAGLNLAHLTLSGGTQGLALSGVLGSISTVEIRDNEGADFGGGIGISNSSDMNISNLTIEGNGAGNGGGLHLDSSSTAELTDCRIANNEALESGGGIYAAGTLVVDSTTLQDNSAGSDGGGVYATGASPYILSSAFWGNTAGENGGGFALESSTVGSTDPLVIQTEFWLNAAGNNGGAISLDQTSAFWVREVLAVLNTAGNDGGGLWISAGQPTLTFIRAWHNEAGNDGGGAYITGSYGGTTRKSSFGGNTAGNSGGGAVHSLANSSHPINNNRYIENSASVSGGGLVIDGDTNGKMSAINLDVVGNSGGGISVVNSSLSRVVNVISASNDGDGIAADAASGTAIVLKNNDVTDNTDGYGGALTDREGLDGNINSDPMFTRFDLDGDPISDFLLTGDESPCRNAGKADIVNLDGTRSHIGSYGGVGSEGGDEDGDGVGPLGGDCDDGDPLSVPGATEIEGDGRDNDCEGGGELDLDGDGYLDPLDCDDHDADVYPGADDVTGDGIDADCDGMDGEDTGDADADGGPPAGADTGGPWVDEDTGDDPFEDADNDGFESGEDCNDADPDSYPGATEICDDGADNDCDGKADANDTDCMDGTEKGCGCASAPTSPTGFVWALLSIGVLIRRRR